MQVKTSLYPRTDDVDTKINYRLTIDNKLNYVIAVGDDADIIEIMMLYACRGRESHEPDNVVDEFYMKSSYPKIESCDFENNNIIYSLHVILNGNDMFGKINNVSGAIVFYKTEKEYQYYTTRIKNNFGDIKIVYVKISLKNHFIECSNNFDFYFYIEDKQYYKLPILHMFKLIYNLDYYTDSEYIKYLTQYKYFINRSLNKKSSQIYCLISDYDYRNMNSNFNYN